MKMYVKILLMLSLLLQPLWVLSSCSEDENTSSETELNGGSNQENPFELSSSPDPDAIITSVSNLPSEADSKTEEQNEDTEGDETSVSGDAIEEGEDLWGIPEDPEEGEFGWPCEEGTECNSGWCVQTAVGKVCTENCLENCPPSWVCSAVSNTGLDTTFICKPKYLHLCDPCTSNTDCADDGAPGAKCVPYGAVGSFCGVDCSEGKGCPQGYSCKSFDGAVPGLSYEQCAPDSGECSCSPLAESLGLATACFNENNLGACEGTAACIEGQGLSKCDAKSPEPEVCDQQDNDCNGIIDDIGNAIACNLENEFGICQGILKCSEGIEECLGDPPTPELCDGLDNDCDGETDEDLCDDGDPCTKDTCVQLEDVLDCSHQIDDTLLCDDGDICTTTDKCEEGVCVGFNPQICDDGNPCTVDSCDATIGCLTTFNADPCEDGNECTEGDTCVNGSCEPGPTKTCDDSNSCTTDSCDPAVAGGCVYAIANEGLLCEYPGSAPQCKTSVCSLGTCSLVNADGQNCTTSSSECPSGVCSGGSCNVIAGTICEVDGGVCSSDVPGSCTPSGSCVPQADGGCVCDSPCNGVCLCCKIGGLIPVQVCIPF